MSFYFAHSPHWQTLAQSQQQRHPNNVHEYTEEYFACLFSVHSISLSRLTHLIMT